ncbi:MAG: hypothetical protein FJW83_03925 [Actinobacteria bacterium]|nr:hypothetical protein [Actinomycetota bacterium]
MAATPLDPDVLRRIEPFRHQVVAIGEPVDLGPTFGPLLDPFVLPVRHDGAPATLVNFVVTLDGAVRLSHDEPDSVAVARHSLHDWLLLGLLRALASTIVIGAEPLRVGRGAQTAARAAPGLAAEFGELRTAVGLGALHHVVVTASGDLPPDAGVWSEPSTVVTTAAGAERLRLPSTVEVVVDPLAAPDRVRTAFAHEVAQDRTPRRAGTGRPGLILCEPGPALLAELLRAEVVDELFLTLSPLIAGEAAGRLGLVGGPARVPLELRGLAVAGSHVFTRWAPEPNEA